jgi:hypothetical protein
VRRNGTYLHHDDARVIRNGKYIYSAQGNTTTHLGPFERVDQTAFADVGARFVRLEEAGKCRSRARCQVRTLADADAQIGMGASAL